MYNLKMLNRMGAYYISGNVVSEWQVSGYVSKKDIRMRSGTMRGYITFEPMVGKKVEFDVFSLSGIQYYKNKLDMYDDEALFVYYRLKIKGEDWAEFLINDKTKEVIFQRLIGLSNVKREISLCQIVEELKNK